MKKTSGVAPSPWLQLMLAVLAILPWFVLLTNAISPRSTPPRQTLSYEASHPLTYDLNYQVNSH